MSKPDRKRKKDFAQLALASVEKVIGEPLGTSKPRHQKRRTPKKRKP